MVSGMVREKRGKKYVVLRLPDGEGSRKEQWFSVEKELGPEAGPRAMNKLLRDKLGELETFKAIIGTNKTVDSFISEWLEIKKSSISPASFESYERTIRIHILPIIGPYKLNNLTKKHMQKYISDLTKNGISARLVHYVHMILSQAFDQAITWNMISQNPIKNVTLPQYRRKDKIIWTIKEFTDFQFTIKGHPMELIFLLYSATGCRRGEILALSWDCIDYENNGIHIKKSLSPKKEIGPTKTEGSTRFVSLPLPIMDMLKVHHAKQEKDMESLGIGNKYDAVFLSKNNTLYYPKNVLDSFKRLCRQAQVPVINIHSLRHLQASWLIADGLDIKTIQNRLGHSRAQTTLDVYGHMLDHQQRLAANAIANRICVSNEPTRDNIKIVNIADFQKKA
mgnify:CR=1 FL=1